ncbi:MAG: hypothetical protein C0478_15535 [Planctomyces sp.]|nr:hypothetical protein [Planctomyces sp.]
MKAKSFLIAARLVMGISGIIALAAASLLVFRTKRVTFMTPYSTEDTWVLTLLDGTQHTVNASIAMGIVGISGVIGTLLLVSATLPVQTGISGKR